MNQMQVFEIIKRDALAIYSPESLKEKLESGKKLKIKLGADPSRPDLHLGHSVVLRKLRLLQDLGHEIIFVIGDFTGMIGDPSGRNKTRQPLTFEQTRENGQTYLKQVSKILDPQKTTTCYNSQWLSKMNFADVLTLAGTYTVARIMERDDFAKRFAENSPIGMHEMFYPLMQGYDSVALEADIEVGGSDQTFNLLVGRAIQKDYGQPSQEVIIFPLLPGLDGIEKMSKSLDNYIGIDEPAEVMFEKCMKVPDTLLHDYFRLTTDLPADVFTAWIQEDIRQAHFAYAKEIVTMYWGAEFASQAKQRYEEVSKGNIPLTINEFMVNPGENALISILNTTGLASSHSDARRLIQGGGVKVNNEKVSDINFTFDFSHEKEFVLSKGKKFVKVKANQ